MFPTDRGASSVTLCDVAEDAISIGGVDLADPDTFMSGMPPSRGTRTRTDPGSWH